jgi:uncharacterized protein with PIN domain
MSSNTLEMRFDEELWLFLAARDRRARTRVAYDGTSSLGHVVESLGVPLTEVGTLRVDGERVATSHRPRDGALVEVSPIVRPQPVPMSEPDPNSAAGSTPDGETMPRFLLDVHLGTLARRLRLLGLDAAYRCDSDDDALLREANVEQRVLLTQDRGLLRRRRLWFGAFVRGANPDQQLADVLDRFAPDLAPWTRCLACDGLLTQVPKREVEDELQPGTRRTYDAFARCRSCGRVYWPGAHYARLTEIVHAAQRQLGRTT